jgi:hypothetical protein
MDAFSQITPDADGQAPDPRLQPTPDYGTLGAGSDAKIDAREAAPSRPAAKPAPRGAIIAMAVGGSLAALVAGAGSARPALTRFADRFSFSKPPVVSSAKDFQQLSRMRPQKQAEVLLQLAVAHSDEAREQISTRVDRWRGKLNWAELVPLFTAALNSNDLRVREAGI